tara:strand:+ start:969 stop:1592 length:624 start_codon:yes stop_codon:yes gene_type:complete
MTFSSYLADNETPLVLDTSVLINLHACTYGERILTALPHDIIVPEVVAKELEHETSKVNGEHGFLHILAESGKVRIAMMTEMEIELFAKLITGSPSLDDGEAATIAIATSRNLIPVIDEKKGRAKAANLAPHRPPGWSLELLRHPGVLHHLSGDEAIDALHLALRVGRMRIPEEHCDDVVKLIGTERAVECTCLPKYRTRYESWKQV